MSKKQIQVLDNLVLVKPEEAVEVTAAGIYIPDNSKEKPLFGTVVSVGNTCKWVKEGDKVLYGKYAGTDIPFKKEDHKFMRETDLFSITESFEHFK